MANMIQRMRRLLDARKRTVAVFMNSISLPGMRGAGLFDVMTFLFISLRNPRFNLAAMAMAYRFFFTLFPAMILLFTLIPYIPIPHFKDEVTHFLSTVVPEDSLGFVYRVVDEFFAKPNAGIIYLNILLVLFSALSGIKVMMQAFAIDHKAFRQRNVIRKNLVALVIFFALILIFITMLGILIYGDLWIGNMVKEGVISKHGFSEILLWGLYYLVLFFALQVSVSVIYFFGPSLYRRWSFFSPGSIVAGILILIANAAFRYFFSNFADYNKIYGSLGAIMLTMVWFYWISIVLLIGFELNAAIERAVGEGKNLVDEAISQVEKAEA